MAGHIHDWSTTAASNNTADSTINWSEGQLPGTVNDSARAMMAAEASWIKDNGGTVTTSGSAGSNTYTATLNEGITSYSTGMTAVLTANFSNTTACTLNVNAIGAKAIKVVAASGEADPQPNAIRANGKYFFFYDSTANSSSGAWILPAPTVANIAFPATQAASSDANTLDDYEEGTFTPAFSFGGGTTGITYSVQTGLYTKIGRSVRFSLLVTLTSKGSSTGTWLVTGLPFTCNATIGAASSVTWIAGANFASGDSPSSSVDGGATTISLRCINGGTNVVTLDNTYATNTTSIAIAGEYAV